jgi:MinD-like ATPase involved in chromosome partitioning or flagellar assembly
VWSLTEKGHSLSIPHPSLVAVVSGKGGVGKTIISANFARLAANDQRSLLLDFDFPNQGLSGLLSEFLKSGCFSAKELIQAEEIIDLGRIISVRENLYFIPAFDPADVDRFSFNPNQLSVAELVEILRRRIASLIQACNLDLVILDCHGGLDHISYASFQTSHCTIVISEPDLVTFNGTLELFDYYVENYTAAYLCADGADVSAHCLPGFAESQHDNVILLFNRMSGRFSYGRLLSAYRGQLSTNFPLIASMVTQYVMIPADSILARSFSEYPFYLELLPESVFAQKLSLTYRKIFGQWPKIHGRSLLYKLFEKKRPNKLEKYLQSDDERRTRAVFAFTSGVQFALLCGFIGLAYVGVTTAITARTSGVTVSQQDFFKAAMSSQPWMFNLSNVMIGLVFVGAVYINILIGQYYRDNLRYEYRLFRRGARRVAVTFLVRSLRLLATRIYLAVAAVLFVIASLNYLTVPFIGLLR